MNEYTRIAITITVSRKFVPHRTCAVVNWCAASGVSSTSFSYAAIALCSAPWYMEHAPDVLDERDREQVADEQAEPHDAFGEVERQEASTSSSAALPASSGQHDEEAR